MIASSRQKYAISSPSLDFEVCDARDMSRFANDTFDFILFSFNGIDYISHRDRLRVFAEIRRVGKPGGYFYFSSHNLQMMEAAWTWRQQLCWNPINTYVNLVMCGLLRMFNRPISLTELKVADYAFIQDESHNFSLQTYYIRPQKQLEQLADYFTNITPYSWQTGLKITDHQELNVNLNQWLYYLCGLQ